MSKKATLVLIDRIKKSVTDTGNSPDSMALIDALRASVDATEDENTTRSVEKKPEVKP